MDLSFSDDILGGIPQHRLERLRLFDASEAQPHYIGRPTGNDIPGMPEVVGESAPVPEIKVTLRSDTTSSDTLEPLDRKAVATQAKKQMILAMLGAALDDLLGSS